MYLNNAASDLVIMLSIILSIFLIIGIIVLVKGLQILNQIKRITEKAERFANTAESVGEFFSAATGPAAIGKIIANVSDAMKKRKEKNGE